jgi:hypothetical protein
LLPTIPTNGKVVAHQRLEVPARQAEGAVAEQRDDLLVRGARCLAPSTNGTPTPSVPSGPGSHPVARRLRLHDLAGEGDDVAAVADVDRVLGEELVDLVSRSRYGSMVTRRSAGGAAAWRYAASSTARSSAIHARVGRRLAAGRLGDRGQHAPASPTMPEVDVAVLADGAVSRSTADPSRAVRSRRP